MSDKQFPELVDKLISRRLEAMWTCIPAIVDSVNLTNYTCSIRPKVKLDGAELPIIPDVPILAMKGGSSVILMPVAAGDIVLALFSKYALTELLKDQNPANHKDVRRFSIDDAMVLPGLFTGVDSVPSIAADEMLLYHKSGAYIKFLSNGDLKVRTNDFDIQGIGAP